MTDRSELRKLASEATAGEWKYENDGTLGGILVRPPTGRPHRHDSPADAQFIAAANPQTVIALLDQLDRAEAELEQLRISLGLSQTRERQATEACSALSLENQRLRDAAKLSKYIDDEIDEVLEDSEETDVTNAQLEAQLSACRAALAEACDLAQRYAEVTLLVDDRIQTLRSVGQPK